MCFLQKYSLWIISYFIIFGGVSCDNQDQDTPLVQDEGGGDMMGGHLLSGEGGAQAGTQDAQAGTQDAQAGTQDAQAGTQDAQAGTQDAQAGTQDAQAGTQAEIEAECSTVCDSLLMCVMERCEEIDQSEREMMRGACEARCQSFEAFASIGAGIDRCEDWLSFAEQQLDESFVFGSACGLDSSGFPSLPECEPFGAQLAHCVVEVCSPFEEIEEEGASLFQSICATQVGSGDVPLSSFVRVTAETECTDPFLSIYISYLTEANASQEDSGGLSLLCAEGLLNEREVCESACEQLSPCIPEGSEGEALRDPSLCRYHCATNDDPVSTVWECFAEVEGGCVDIGQCFEER